MNLTITIDDRILDRARALARRRGVSLQDLLRRYLESIVGERPRDDIADELCRLMRRHWSRWNQNTLLQLPDRM